MDIKTNEDILIKKSGKGDVKAFGELIEAYENKVFNIALGILKNYDDANDMAQEAFIRIFKSIKSFKGESAFSTWIYRITVNVCLDEFRKRKNKKTFSIDEDIRFGDSEITREIIDDSPSPDTIVEKNELKKVVHDAISELSEEHQTVIVLRDIQGFSYEEISEMTKTPQGTVKSRISRARNALKDILKNKKELNDIYFVK